MNEVRIRPLRGGNFVAGTPSFAADYGKGIVVARSAPARIHRHGCADGFSWKLRKCPVPPFRLLPPGLPLDFREPGLRDGIHRTILPQANRRPATKPFSPFVPFVSFRKKKP